MEIIKKNAIFAEKYEKSWQKIVIAYHGTFSFHGMTQSQSELRFSKWEEEIRHKRANGVISPEKEFTEFFLLRVNQFIEVAQTLIKEWKNYSVHQAGHNRVKREIT